ncbi:hypothetical protein NLG97_g9462 [Lecanicillium saksenae]|uniref:Uncharacterized protein n=1 Tax=Lecanicillium saksenae TaxID=468837 RepID=A0ACC1QGH1_9HYPO|nr:hypothetical protein NLG97_g9462 [Lecanicillium saksenae]
MDGSRDDGAAGEKSNQGGCRDIATSGKSIGAGKRLINAVVSQSGGLTWGWATTWLGALSVNDQTSQGKRREAASEKNWAGWTRSPPGTWENGGEGEGAARSGVSRQRKRVEDQQKTRRSWLELKVEKDLKRKGRAASGGACRGGTRPNKACLLRGLKTRSPYHTGEDRDGVGSG